MLKNYIKKLIMRWLLTWLNKSVATLNATLQLLVIYWLLLLLLLLLFLNDLDFDAGLFCRNKELKREFTKLKERRLKIKPGKFLSFLQSFSLLNYNEDIVWFGFGGVNSYSLELLDSLIKHVFEHDWILYDSEICD